MTLGTAYPAAHAAAAHVLASLGRYDEAIAEWRIAGLQSGDSVLVRLLEGASGREGVERFVVQNAKRELARRDARRAGAFVAPTEYSSLHAMLGDTARALDWLERARDERDPNAAMSGCHSEYDPLRESPRFKALLQSMHLTSATFGRRPVWSGAGSGGQTR